MKFKHYCGCVTEDFINLIDGKKIIQPIVICDKHEYDKSKLVYILLQHPREKENVI